MKIERYTFAALTVGVGLLVGLLGNILFYGKVIGLSFPIFSFIMVITLLALGFSTQLALRLRNLWPLLPLAFFAVMVAVRADSTVFLDVLAVLALGALTLHYLPLQRVLDEDSLRDYARGIMMTALAVVPQFLFEFFDSWSWLRQKRLQDHGPFVAIGRGLLLATPVLVVFAVLLGSADAVFANYLDRVAQALVIHNAGDVIAQGMLTGILSMVASGALAYGLARRIPVTQDSEWTQAVEADTEPRPANKRVPKPFRIGIIESGIILGSVDLLLGAFVLIQFTYFFGGQANISVEGLTYAEYARRGFFELVAVSVLTLGLILTLDHITIRREGQQNTIFRALAVIIVTLTLVILVAASQRMALYEEAYGYTHLRVYTHVFMCWLAVLLGVALLSLFRVRRQIFSLGTLVVMIGYLGTLNLMNVDYYIAEQNIGRYYNGHELDVAYLRTLSTDAVPPMVGLYQSVSDDLQLQQDVGLWLSMQLYRLDRLREGEGATIFSANVSREQAWALLDSIRADLPVYEPPYWTDSRVPYELTAESRSGS